jgi:hypothetical protein
MLKYILHLHLYVYTCVVCPNRRNIYYHMYYIWYAPYRQHLDAYLYVYI